MRMIYYLPKQEVMKLADSEILNLPAWWHQWGLRFLPSFHSAILSVRLSSSNGQGMATANPRITHKPKSIGLWQTISSWAPLFKKYSLPRWPSPQHSAHGLPAVNHITYLSLNKSHTEIGDNNEWLSETWPHVEERVPEQNKVLLTRKKRGWALRGSRKKLRSIILSSPQK